MSRGGSVGPVQEGCPWLVVRCRSKVLRQLHECIQKIAINMAAISEKYLQEAGYDEAE